MAFQVPQIGLEQEQLYRWPAWKFGLDEAELWQSLHQRFNTTQIAVESFDGWYLDVYEIARALPKGDVSGLYKALQERREERELALRRAWLWITRELVYHPECFDSEEQKTAHMHFAQNFSLDSLVLLADRLRQRPERRQRAATAAASSSTAAAEASAERDVVDGLVLPPSPAKTIPGPSASLATPACPDAAPPRSSWPIPPPPAAPASSHCPIGRQLQPKPSLDPCLLLQPNSRVSAPALSPPSLPKTPNSNPAPQRPPMSHCPSKATPAPRPTVAIKEQPRNTPEAVPCDKKDARWQDVMSPFPAPHTPLGPPQRRRSSIHSLLEEPEGQGKRQKIIQHSGVAWMPPTVTEEGDEPAPMG